MSTSNRHTQPTKPDAVLQVLSAADTALLPCPDNVHFIGIRHHSPRCASMVAQWITEQRPDVVLIEAPSDVKSMLPQLLLPHTLPIALFSYRQQRIPRQRVFSNRDTVNDKMGTGGNGEDSFGTDVVNQKILENDSQGDIVTAQSWFPLLPYSPEWVAIQTASNTDAVIEFIDLPHWSYRAQITNLSHELADTADTDSLIDISNRYNTVLARLLTQSRCDNHDALWELWFEGAPDNATAAKRLTHYFHLLRGMEPHKTGDVTDNCREGYMASWVAYHLAAAPDAKILVVCGGWHVNGIKQQLDHMISTQPALESTSASKADCPPDLNHYLQQYFSSATSDLLTKTRTETEIDKTDNTTLNDTLETIIDQGNYLIPIDYTQVEPLTGYAAGMPSPQYYEWLYSSKMCAATTFDKAVSELTHAIRAAKQPLSTTDMVAWMQTSAQLAQLRGMPAPYRQELLDGLLSGVMNEALTIAPPWSHGLQCLQEPDSPLGHTSQLTDSGAVRQLQQQDHPFIRLALSVLTGKRQGRLATQTPAPPLIKSVENDLTALGLLPSDTPTQVTLSYRHTAERSKLHALWQLKVIGVTSVSLQASTVSLLGQPATQQPAAKSASVNVPPTKNGKSKHINTNTNLQPASERWLLHKNEHWHIELIKASRFGAMLIEASKAALLEQLYHASHTTSASEQVLAIGQVLRRVILCGFDDLVAVLSQRLHDLITIITDRGAISQLGQMLIDIMRGGFYDMDIETLVTIPFVHVVKRLLWLLDSGYIAQSNNEQAAKQDDINGIQVLMFAAAQAKYLNEATHFNGNKYDKPSVTLPILDIAAIMHVLYRLAINASASKRYNADANIQTTPAHTLQGAAVAAYLSLSEQMALSSYFIVTNYCATPYMPKCHHGLAGAASNVRFTALHWQLVPEQLPQLRPIMIVQAIPLMIDLGDFLLGLFAISRHSIVYGKNDGLLRSLHYLISDSAEEDFLRGLPSLRQAFSWLPPKERHQLAKRLARMMGLDAKQAADWQALLRSNLPQSPDTLAHTLVTAKQLEQQTCACLLQLLST